MGNLLCVSNARVGTGYAWDHISMVYRALADRNPDQTWVAFREVDTDPGTLVGLRCHCVELPVRFNESRSVLALIRFIRRHRITHLYLTDRATAHPVYAVLRAAGVKRITVHDRTSGERTRPPGLVRLAKRLIQHMPLVTADAVVAVSDFVARRQVEVAMVPPSRVFRVWNTFDSRSFPEPADLRSEFGIGPQQPVVICASRAVKEKGVETLLQAFDRVQADAVLVYFGDGPDLPHFREVAARLQHPERVVLAGYRSDVRAFIAASDVCVVPSVWAEAFGNAALEPMMLGVPVIASAIGGLPEVIAEECGILVPPGDVDALAMAIQALLNDPARRSRMGVAGRRRASSAFDRRKAMDELTRIILGSALRIGDGQSGARSTPV